MYSYTTASVTCKNMSLAVTLLLVTSLAKAQSAFKGMENLFTLPLTYTVVHTTKPVIVDGAINDSAWQQAAWTTYFQDIEGTAKPTPDEQTRVKMLWDDSCLYIAAQLQESNVWATLKRHDDIVFNNNDFEVFIDPDNNTHQYFEIEVNALNTLFDLFLNKPYRNKGNAMINWDVENMKSAVQVQGTLNNPNDKDEGWTVEMAIPFKSISLGNNVQVPTEGSTWRINFSRVEWDVAWKDGQYVRKTDSAGHRLPEHNWVWSAQGVVNMHYPERWGYLLFSRQAENPAKFELPYAELQKRYLWLLYYRQQKYFEKHQQYALSLKQLGITNKAIINYQTNMLKMEATPHQFYGIITDAASKDCYTINQEGLVQKLNK